jgi:hypothetical protein
MSKKSSGKILNTILNITASFLLVFAIIISYAGYLADNIVSSPQFCTSQIEENQISQKVYDSLKLNLDLRYNSTAIPSEVYLNAITTEWLDNSIKEQILSSYRQFDNPDEVYSADYTALEQSLTEYFEKYADENNVLKDDVYEKKLEDTITEAKSLVSNAYDVYKLETMKKANIWSKVKKVRDILNKILPLCIVGIVILIIILILLKNPIYWIGASLFADGFILTVPSALILSSSLIMRFSIKEPAIYSVVTSAMTSLTKTVMTAGIIMIVISLIMITSDIIINKK